MDALVRFLALSREPSAGAALYDAYASDAPLYFRGAVRPREGIDRGEFAWVVAAGARQHARAHGGEPARPALDAPTILSCEEDGDRAVVWFRAQEAVAGADVTGAAGLQREAGAWKVAWATLAPEVQPWSWGLGRAQAVADAGFAEAAGLLAPRGWLDVAYWRMALKPRPPLLTLPEARFRCHASLGCCDIGFRISLPASAQAVVDALPWAELRPELAGTRLTPLEPGKLLLKEADEPCRFLDAQRRCEIHKALGRQPFPTCARYPAEFTDTPDGVAVSLYMTCPSSRAALGPPLLERAEDLYERLALRPPGKPPAEVRLAPDRPIPWAAWQAAEAALLDALAAEGPLPARLMAGTAALAAAVGEADPPADVANWRALADLVAGALDPTPGPPGPGPEYDMVPVLRTLVFAKKLAFTYDLATAWNVGVFGAVVANRLRARRGGPLAADVAWRLGQLLFHGDPFEVLSEEGERAAMRAAFGRPGFARDLLAEEPETAWGPAPQAPSNVH